MCLAQGHNAVMPVKLELEKFCPFVLKILNGKEILALIKGHNTGPNVQKMTANNSNVDLVSMNSYEILVKICQFILKILSRNEILE